MKIVKVIREIHTGGYGIIHEVELEGGDRVARKTFNPLLRERMDDDTLQKFKSSMHRLC